jgi:ankyrin repeat protein
MKKILLSLLLAGGVQNSFAMQAGGAASSSDTQPALSEVSKQLFEAAKNKGYFKFLTTMPQLACNTLKDHPKTAAATGFFAASCAAYYLYNKFNKSSLSQQPGEDVKNVMTSSSGGVELAGSDAAQVGMPASNTAGSAAADTLLQTDMINTATNEDVGGADETGRLAEDVGGADETGRLAIDDAEVVQDFGGETTLSTCELNKQDDTNASQNSKLMQACGGAAQGGIPASNTSGSAAVDALSSTGKGLIDEAKKGDLQNVTRLLQAQANVNEYNAEGLTALMSAAKNGHAEVVKVLLQAGANVDNVIPDIINSNSGVDENEDFVSLEVRVLPASMGKDFCCGTTALMIAALKGHSQVVKELLEAKANVNIQNVDKSTALMLAAKHGHLQIVKELLEKGADINIQNTKGETALMLALHKKKHIEVIRELLNQSNVNLSLQDSNGSTALILAALYGKFEIVSELLGNNADVNARDNEGNTALMVAAQLGHAAVVNLLCNYKANFEVKNNEGRTALIDAAQLGHAKVVELLCHFGADTNAIDKIGRTALMQAVMYGHEAVVRLLLENRADVNARDNYDETALKIALESGYTEIVKLLIYARANVNAKDSHSRTALMCAAEHGHTEAVQLLIAYGADVNVRDNEGWTALMIAVERGHTEIADSLRAHDASE